MSKVMYYKFTLGDLKEIKSELNDLENELQDKISDTLYMCKISDTQSVEINIKYLYMNQNF